MSHFDPHSERLPSNGATSRPQLVGKGRLEEPQFVKCMTVAFVGTLSAGVLYPTAAVCVAILLPGYQSILGPPSPIEFALVLAGWLAVSMLSFSISIASFILSTIVVWIVKIWYARLFVPRMAFAVAGGLSGAIPFLLAYWFDGNRLMIIPFFLLAVVMGHSGAVVAGYRSQYRILFLQPVIPSQFPIRLRDLFSLTVVVAFVLLFQRLSGLPLFLPLMVYLGWQFVLLVVDEWIRGRIVQAMIDKGKASV